MYRIMLKSKIHRAKVTETNINYEGSITIDEELLQAANMAEHEQVQVYSLSKGHRFETYIIQGKKGSGTICLNGACALLADPGDLVIIASYALVEEEKIKDIPPVIVKVDENNKKKD